jgi:hypothetical protein
MDSTRWELAMKRVKLVGVALGVLLVLAVMVSNAFALPDISVTLTGGTYPVHLNGSIPVKTELGSASGVVLEGKGVTLLLLTTELSALGTFDSTFTNVEDPNNGKKCNNVGQTKETGNVLVTGEFHLVLYGPTPEQLGILFLVTFLEIECGTFAPEVRGDVLGSVQNAGSEGTELTGLAGELTGSLGKQTLSEYLNAGGTIVKAKLETEAGSGFVATDQNVGGVIGLSVLGSQMIVITGR